MINEKYGYMRTYDSNNNNLSYDRILTPKTNYNFNNKFNPNSINSRDNSIERNRNISKSNYKTLKNAVSLTKEKQSNNSNRSKQSSFDNSINKFNHQSSVNNYLNRRHQETQQKLMKIKNENAVQELKEIKDKPIISENSRKIIESKSHSKINVFDRLTSKSHNRKKEMEIKKLEEMNNKNTLKPKINDYSNQIQRSIDDLLSWKENLMQKREYQINEINSHLIKNPSINKLSEEILKEKNPDYLGKKVEDRLIQQGMISKYKIEGKKELYYDNPNNSKRKNNQIFNRNEFNLENIMTGASELYDNFNMSPTSMKNLKKFANNNPQIQKEINTSIINNSENYYSDTEKINKESMTSPKIITLPRNNNPYNLHPNIKSKAFNQAKIPNNSSNFENQGQYNQFDNINNFKNISNINDNRTLTINKTGSAYERYSNKLIPPEKFLSLNTVDQIVNEDNKNYQDTRNQIYEEHPDNKRDIDLKKNKNLDNQIDSYNQRRINSHNQKMEEVNKLPNDRNNSYYRNSNYSEQRNKIIIEQNRKIIDSNNIDSKNDLNNSQQNLDNRIERFDKNNFNQNSRLTPNFNVNTYLSPKGNNFNFKNYSSSMIPNTTKNRSFSNENQFNLNQNESSCYVPNNNYNMGLNNQSGKTNYSARINSGSRNNQTNISREKSNNIPNQKGFISVKNSTNRSFESKDFYNNNKNVKNITKNNDNSGNILAQSNKNNLKNNKSKENGGLEKTIKPTVESNLSPSEKIVDIRKHLDSYYKTKQVESKNNYFKEFMTTHDHEDSAIKNILSDYNSGNNYIQNSSPILQNFDVNQKTQLNNEFNNNYVINDNSDIKRFNYKDFKQKVLQDYQNAKNSNKNSFLNNPNSVNNKHSDNIYGEKYQISSIQLNNNLNKMGLNDIGGIQSEPNQNQIDERNNQKNYNFRKDLIYNQNSNAQNTILNLKNNYNNLNREFQKINEDLVKLNANPDKIPNRNENPVNQNINKIYVSRGTLKNDRTNNLNNTDIQYAQTDNLNNLSNNINENNNIFNFKREKNETSHILNTENSIKPANPPNNTQIFVHKNESKSINESYQNSERKINNSKSSIDDNYVNENFNSRERDINSIKNFMKNLHIINSSDVNENNNMDGNLKMSNNNQVNYEGEINEISNRIEYINEKLKLNEINRNFVMTKIDSKKRIDLNN